MSTLDDQKFKERLEILEKEAHRSSLNFDTGGRISLGTDSKPKSRERKLAKSRNWYRNLLIVLVSFNIIYLSNQFYDVGSLLPEGISEAVYFSDSDVEAATASLNRYDSGLLERMGAMMEELGYTNLTPAHLAALRDKGLTATYTAQLHSLGYTNLSLNDLVRMRQRDVSSRFVAMMQSLGYEGLSVDELVRLRDNGVTAYYTSNLHDLGYTDLTTDDLIRLQNVGVSINTVKRLIRANGGEKPSLEDILRYQISNQ